MGCFTSFSQIPEYQASTMGEMSTISAVLFQVDLLGSHHESDLLSSLSSSILNEAALLGYYCQDQSSFNQAFAWATLRLISSWSYHPPTHPPNRKSMILTDFSNRCNVELFHTISIVGRACCCLLKLLQPANLLKLHIKHVQRFFTK